MSDRPDGWRNPFQKKQRVPSIQPALHRAYEQGADAMLKAKQKEGCHENRVS